MFNWFCSLTYNSTPPLYNQPKIAFCLLQLEVRRTFTRTLKPRKKKRRVSSHARPPHENGSILLCLEPASKWDAHHCRSRHLHANLALGLGRSVGLYNYCLILESIFVHDIGTWHRIANDPCFVSEVLCRKCDEVLRILSNNSLCRCMHKRKVRITSSRASKLGRVFN